MIRCGRCCGWFLGLGLTALLVACQRSPSPQVRVAIPELRRSNYDFIPEQWQERRLAALYAQERLGEIKALSQMDLFLKLCAWTHRQWPHSVPNPWPLDNALDILSAIRAGSTGGWCGQYAYVLADVIKAMGYFNVRYVELCRADGETHFVVEVWSDELRKWLVLDPDYGCYFRLRQRQVPASALEVRASLFGGPEVEAVPIEGDSVSNGVVTLTSEQLSAFFAHVAVSLRSDLMRHRQPYSTRERFDSFLFLRDAHTGPPYDKQIPFRNVTERVEDLDWDCDLVQVTPRISRDRVDLELATLGSMPNFRQLQWRTPGQGDWKVTGARLSLPRQEGTTVVEVVPVNQLGRVGVVQRVEVTW